MAILIDDYDLMVDGDMIVIYELSYINQAEQRRRQRAILGTGGPESRFVSLHD